MGRYLANPNVIIGHPSAVGAARQLWGKSVKQAPCRVQTTQPAAGDVVKVTSATGGEEGGGVGQWEWDPLPPLLFKMRDGRAF